MKLLIVTHNYIRAEGDFAGVFLHLMARKLSENGVEVHVVAPHDAAIAEYEEIGGVKVYRFRYARDDKETLAYRGDMHRQVIRNPLKLFRLWRFLRASYKLCCRVIEREKIELVSVNWLIPNGIVGGWLRKKYGERIDLLLSSHGTDIRLLVRFPIMLAFLKRTIRQARRWTVVSNYLKELIVGKDAEAAEKIEVLPFPSDETIFYPDDAIEKDADLVVAVARLTKQKRLSYLIAAIKSLVENRPGIKLNIYGGGPEKGNLEREIDDFGLVGRVRILKPIPQSVLREVYNRASVVVLNSVGEGFGLALVEAMLCRTAVVGTRSGGITDIIDEDENGLLVAPDDVEELAGAIERLLGDKALRERLAGAGYKKAREWFSSEGASRQFRQLISERDL